MSSSIQQKTQHLAIAHRRRRSWLRIVTAMACVVVFMTTYALILPAITADAADLKQYLNDTGGSIIAVTDLEDIQVIPETTYPLSLLVTGGETGFSPGIYFYKLPQSVNLKTLLGYDIVSGDNEKIGSWSVDENETIIFDFTEAAQIPDIQIDLALEITFDETEEPISFDGGTQVYVYTTFESSEDEASDQEASEDTVSEDETSVPTESEEEEFSQDVPTVYAGTFDLKTYVTDANGKISVELFDSNGQKITDTVVADESYKLAFGVSLPEDAGFEPGTYTYQFPTGVVMAPQGPKDLKVTDGTVIGTWTVTADGLLTFEFNDASKNYQNPTTVLEIVVSFDESQGNIEFEGKVNITIEPAPEKPVVTAQVRKSGEVDDKDATKLSWALSIQGGTGFSLGGQTITDYLEGSNHYYADDDDSIWVEVYNGDTYYSWEIDRDDQDIEWTENGWTYTIPTVIQCVACNDPMYADPDYTGSAVHDWTNPHSVTVGDDWLAWFFYESTITDDGTGTYTNTAQVGALEDTATVLPVAGVGIVKTGELVDGQYQWTIDVNIPGGETPTNFWYLWDSMKIKPNNNTTYPSDIWQSTVTAEYNGQTVTVPYYKNATATDRFAWSYWFDEDEPEEGSEFDFLHICQCTAETCALWTGSSCGNDHYKGADGTIFCRCWPETTNVAFRISYVTEDSAQIIENHGGSGETVRNSVGIYHKPVIDGVEQSGVWLAGSEEYLPIPSVFNKSLLEKPGETNLYTAKFNITVNEEFQDLSAMSDSGGVTIVDTMSETLFYESGSMVVHQTDAAGNTVLLREGTDYIVTLSNAHKLTINIPNPGPYKYTLDYSCVLNLEGQTGSIEYNNTAEIELFGQKYTVGGTSEFVTNYIYSADRFQITVTKTDSISGELLPRAVFELYNDMGNLMAALTTDENGRLIFETDLEKGLVFRKNQAYYLQEAQAPPGYTLDQTKRWFYFATEPDETLQELYPDIQYVGLNSGAYVGSFQLTNVHQMFQLPSTGSSGEAMFYCLSAAAFVAALLTGGGALLFRKKRLGRK